MKGILNVDSKFGRKVVMFNQTLILSVLFLLFSLPIFTWGASACALYANVRKVLREEDGKIFSEFWQSFKSCFKQGVLVGCLTLAFLTVVIYCMLQILRLNLFGGSFGTILWIVYIFIVAAILAWVHILISYIARFQDNMRTVLYNSVYFALLHYNVTFRMMIQMAVVFACFYFVNLFPYLPVVLMVLPSAYSMMTVRPMEKMFSKYMSKDDEEEEDEQGDDEIVDEEMPVVLGPAEPKENTED